MNQHPCSFQNKFNTKRLLFINKFHTKLSKRSTASPPSHKKDAITFYGNRILYKKICCFTFYLTRDFITGILQTIQFTCLNSNLHTHLKSIIQKYFTFIFYQIVFSFAQSLSVNIHKPFNDYHKILSLFFRQSQFFLSVFCFTKVV
mgnify:CR=1 FL=1